MQSTIKVLIKLALGVALFCPLQGRGWFLEEPTLHKARVMLGLDLGQAKLAETREVDRDHKADFYEADFLVPEDIPAFLTVRTESSRRGRLTIHLLPETLPQELDSSKPSEDWFNPARLYDFRAVVEVSREEQELHVLSLNRDFFEAVTRSKRPYDLAGVRIQKIGFHFAYSPDGVDETTVLDVRAFGLTGPAMRDHLDRKLRDITGLWESLPPESTARSFWKPRVEEARVQVEAFNPENPLTSQWWAVLEELEEVRSKSRLWTLEPEGGRHFLLGIVSSLTRISGRHEAFGFAGEIAGLAELDCARNEYESLQLAVIVPWGDEQNFRVRATDLLFLEGSGRIEAGQFAFYHQIEQWIQPSPGTAQSQVGWLPDALLPVDGPFSVSAGQVKPLWVTLKVPLEAESGEYSGSVEVEPEGGEVQKVELKLTVHDFAIPGVGRFRTQGHLDLQGLTAWYGDQDQDRIRRNFYRLLLDHRFSPTSQYSPRLSPEAEDIPWVMEAGGNVILIGGFSGGPLDPAIIDPAYRWLVDHGYVDRAIIYIGDETDDFEGVRAKSRTIRSRWPELRIMVGGSKPREELIGYVDVWDPITFGGQTYNFDPVAVREAIGRDEEVFWYTCVGPRWPFANVYNDHPLTAIRALWWQAWKYGITGFEYWWFNWWRSNLRLSQGTAPWPSSRVWEWNSRAYDWANGDGLFVYPGPQGRPLASLRLSVVRDAIEDWEVLFLLERAVEQVEAGNLSVDKAVIRSAERILKVPVEITSSLTSWSEDPEVYLWFRREMYRLLSNLRMSIGAVRFDEYVAEWEKERQERSQKSFEARVLRTAASEAQ